MRELRFITKFMASWTRKLIITINILPNISSSKGNHKMKFGLLMECNMENLFHEKPYKKLVGKTVPNSFNKIKIEHISRSTAWHFIQFVFVVYPSQGLPKYIETKELTTCFYLIESFLKSKRRPGTTLLASFFHDFCKYNTRKLIITMIIHNISLYSINWQNFVVWLPLHLETSVNIVIIVTS